MKRMILSLAATSALLVAAPLVADAAPWQSVNGRQANLEQRINQGVRSGELTRSEAARVRDRFHQIARLEARYRRSGGRLTAYERADLDRRFDRLSEMVYAQKHDPQARF